jgi:hypothetical protein
MDNRTFNEAQAAAMLPSRPSAATLKRWRLAGQVPFCRTPGGRIYYSFEQLVAIGAGMRHQPSAPVRADVIQSAPTSDDTPGEEAIAAE